MIPVDLGFSALATLIPISVLFTIAALLVMRRLSDQQAIRRAKSLVQAHLLEFRLYGDEPRLVFRAQRDLLRENFRLIRLLLAPFLVLALPGVLIFGLLDGCYGRRPLKTGVPAVVTVQFEGAGTASQLQGPAGLAVETPPVHAVSEHQQSWRIRPTEMASGTLRLITPGGVVAKTISAAPDNFLVSERRAGSPWTFLLHPAEIPFRQPGIRWIEVRYPPATILGYHWLLWFFLISVLAALLLKRPLRTAF